MANAPYGWNPADLSYAPNEYPSYAPPHALPPHFPAGAPGTQGQGYCWIPSHTYSVLPQHAVRGGTDQDGSDIIVGRAHFDGDWVPAKVVPDRNQAYVSHGGEEHCVESFDVLCEQRFEWVHASGGIVPFNAVCGGQTSDGEKLYIGRTFHEGSNTVGKVHPSHNCLYIPFAGQELKFNDYEILVRM